MDGPAGRGRGLRATPRRGPELSLQHRRAGLFPDAADRASGRPRVQTATILRRRKWPSSTRHMARRFWGGPSKRSASGSAWSPATGGPSSAWRGRQVRAHQRGAPARTSTCRSSRLSVEMILHTRGTSGVGDADGAGARTHRRARSGPAGPGREDAGRAGGRVADDLRMTPRMLFAFGVAAMGLAAMGIYGLVSYTVKQSTHEIGIRKALGASQCTWSAAFLGRGLRLGAIGAAVGIVAALAATRLLGSVLYGVSATDTISLSERSRFCWARARRHADSGLAGRLHQSARGLATIVTVRAPCRLLATARALVPAPTARDTLRHATDLTRQASRSHLRGPRRHRSCGAARRDQSVSRRHQPGRIAAPDARRSRACSRRTPTPNTRSSSPAARRSASASFPRKRAPAPPSW